MPGKKKQLTATSSMRTWTPEFAEERWNRMLESFRKGDNLSIAARVGGVSWKTARKAFEEGFPPSTQFPAGKPPIKDIVSADKAATTAAAKVELERMEAESGTKDLVAQIALAHEKAIQAHIDARKDGAVASILAARLSTVMLAHSILLAKSVQPLIEQVAQKLTSRSRDMPLDETRALLRDISRFVKDSMDVADKQQNLQKNMLANPQDIMNLGVELHRAESEVDDEEAEVALIELGRQIMGVHDSSELVDLTEGIVDAELVEYEEEEDAEEDEDYEGEGIESEGGYDEEEVPVEGEPS